MAEALKTFREGEDILASETNENNQFLLSKLTDNAAQVQAYVEGEVSTIKSNVSSVQATLQNNIDELANGVGKSVAYIVESYIQDNAGYFVYSDGTIMQWGHYVITATSGAKDTKVTFLKPFTTTGYIIVDSAYYPEAAGDKVNYYGCIAKNTTDMTYRVYQERWANSGNLWWMCIGK